MLSNMYPNQDFPSYGVFVKNFADSLEKNEIQYDKVVMYKSNNKFLKLYRYILFFLKALYSMSIKNYDCIYIHYPSITGIPVLIVSRFKKMTIYTNIHGTDADPVTDKEKNLEKNTKKVAEISEKIIVPSQHFKQMVLNKYNISEERVYIYPSGGINLDVFHPLTDTEVTNLKERLLGADAKKVIGFVSRIERSKGWLTFVEALKLLKNEGELKDVQVVMIGSGKDELLLTEKTKEYRLNDFVTQIDLVSQNELNQYFNLFDLFIFPSHKESLGLVAIEAMATGTSVIASNIPPLNEYIIPNETGELFEKENAEQLASAIKRQLVYTPEESEIIKMNALKMSKRYSRASTNEVFRSIFNLD